MQARFICVLKFAVFLNFNLLANYAFSLSTILEVIPAKTELLLFSALQLQEMVSVKLLHIASMEYIVQQTDYENRQTSIIAYLVESWKHPPYFPPPLEKLRQEQNEISYYMEYPLFKAVCIVVDILLQQLLWGVCNKV